ncbi:tetratricopeptide repeat protein [Actinotalea sp. M2MS4P-6]|uniref:tetratricopeptide repeat protein n=1 Tax=Actinotalea sp. M2MS4P-6 TaxID=2983762 RepID=UPI0021E3E232|nr:tetratricopeptide repeat protein [Actinotalea sp. M2MS4P-6]MCV2394065.1 tetratricopeptide repeat protein [Actinotalea sp. M2MS4P-6]
MSTTPGSDMRLNLHGAVDLSSLGRPPAAPPSAPTGSVVDVTDEATFTAVVQQSTSVPVVLVLWSSYSAASTQVADDLAGLSSEMGGRFLVARLDAEAHPEIAQAIGAQAIPTVLGVLRGQPVPLFQGPAEREQIRALLEKLLEVAEANQITGTVAAEPGEEPAEPEEPPLPPLHAEAYDAIEAGDLDRAGDAYRRALAQNPRDEMAKVGLAQVELLARVQGLDAVQVAQRAQQTTDLDAQLDMADLELAAGQVDEAFARLLAAIRSSAGPDRERVRVRLVALFSLVGDADPSVARARRELASALY